MEKVVQTNIKREKGFMYFIKSDPLEIWRSQAGRKKKEEVKSEPEMATKDIIIEKQQPAILTPVEPAVVQKAGAEIAETVAIAETKETREAETKQLENHLEKEARIKKLEDHLEEVAKEIKGLKNLSDNEFKAFDSKAELEASEGKPKKKRFVLFRKR